MLTTPILTFLTANHKLASNLESYYEHFANAYLEFMSLVTSDNRKYERRMVVDCANGVAALHLSQIASRIESHLKIELINTDTSQSAKLNHNCGADYVNGKVRLPTEISSAHPEKVACLDGDGDRLIYFKRMERAPIVINCDKLYTFLMVYIVEKLELLGVKSAVPLAMINTAYQNSKGKQYVDSNEIPQVKVPTGVKHGYDILR